MYLRDEYPLSQSLRSSVHGTTLLGIRKVFGPEDLEFPILFSERDDEDSIIIELGAIGGSVRECDLCDGYSFRAETMVIDKRTNVEDNFSRCFNYFVNDRLVIAISV